MGHNALRDAAWSARLAEARSRFERAERRRRMKVASVIIGVAVLVVVAILIDGS
jgi:hypothetical protein